MNFKEILLQEKFVEFYDKFEIYKNPTSTEMQKLLKNARENSSANMIRYILDMNNENIYMFPSDLLHAWASKKLGIPYGRSSKEYKGYLFGQGIWDPKMKTLLASYSVIHPNAKYNKKVPKGKKVAKKFKSYIEFVNTGEEYNENTDEV